MCSNTCTNCCDSKHSLENDWLNKSGLTGEAPKASAGDTRYLCMCANCLAMFPYVRISVLFFEIACGGEPCPVTIRSADKAKHAILQAGTRLPVEQCEVPKGRKDKPIAAFFSIQPKTTPKEYKEIVAYSATTKHHSPAPLNGLLANNSLAKNRIECCRASIEWSLG